MSAKDLRGYIPISEFVDRVHYSQRHIRRLCCEGKLEACKIQDGGKWLVKKDQVVKEGRRRHKATTQAALTATTAPLVREHYGDLADAARKLLSNLRFARRYELLLDWPIGEIALSDAERDKIEDIDQFISRCLLSHAQAEIPELTGLRNWGQLTVRDITNELLDRLSVIAWRRTFEGTCDICESWEPRS